MSNDEIETKKLMVERIVKYDAELSSNRSITLGYIGTAIASIYILLNLTRGFSFEMPTVFLHIVVLLGLVSSLCSLLRGIAKKIGLQAKIEEINELLSYYGTSNDEIPKDRSK